MSSLSTRPDSLLSLGEVSRLTGVPISRIQAMIRSGTIRVVRDQSVLCLRRSDVERFWPAGRPVAVPVGAFLATPTVYRLFNRAGELLYVGVTKNVGNRLLGHARCQPWWPDVDSVSTQCFATRAQAEAEEGRAIALEDPLHNLELPSSGRDHVGTNWVPVRFREGLAS